jgi:hypothetical protein
MTLLAFPIGFFYVIAGLLVLRAIAVSSLLDRALEAIAQSKPDPKEQTKTFVLTIGAYLTAASGAALVTLSSMAIILFVLNTLVQGGYLVWATKALPPEDESDRKGRQQTTNAFVIYTAVTAFIIWLGYTGGLRPWPRDAEGVLIDLIAPAMAALACYMLVHHSGMLKRSSGVGFGGKDIDMPVTASGGFAHPTVNLRLRPEFACCPLWDADTGDNVSHYHIAISLDLAERIENWDDRFQAIYKDDNPVESGFASPEEEQAYIEEGRAIARELAEAWPGKVDIEERFR